MPSITRHVSHEHSPMGKMIIKTPLISNSIVHPSSTTFDRTATIETLGPDRGAPILRGGTLGRQDKKTSCGALFTPGMPSFGSVDAHGEPRDTMRASDTHIPKTEEHANRFRARDEMGAALQGGTQEKCEEREGAPPKNAKQAKSPVTRVTGSSQARPDLARSEHTVTAISPPPPPFLRAYCVCGGPEHMSSTIALLVRRSMASGAKGKAECRCRRP
ncbi:hypothetical protein F5148DRAFT_742815 [Russula earlei]|uniref:Uncharacterized protein n=1 Tax=Russula earlei TaxID=71964 RepID=A0ACC0UD79_9AGAM|nr:hypothetical protein F5148DRAFT_742815 [Russula earlei]